ncbi:Uncharacterised protein [Vibrio cholerae]|nr:Uncharacterised protein [Vibrio cholerae]CSI62553.1 Uncharacterised protein [Vibrio cholerae]
MSVSRTRMADDFHFRQLHPTTGYNTPIMDGLKQI